MPSDGPDIWTIVISAAIGAVVTLIGNFIMQGRVRWRDTQIYALSLSREMLLITRKLNSYVKALEDFHKDLSVKKGMPD